MSVARHNPRDSDGRAQALMWDDRLAKEEEFSTNSLIKRFQEYHRSYRRAFKLQEGLIVNQGALGERKALREKRLDNMRIAGPNDGLKGTFQDQSISGDPWWYTKMLKEDGKAPIGPKTDFKPDDFLVEMDQTTKVMNSLSNSSKLQLPVHLPRHRGADEQFKTLQRQYVESHLLYANLLEVQKGVVMTPEHRQRVANALQREFLYLSQNPSAKQKDFSDILTNYDKLGKPTDPQEEILNEKSRQENSLIDAEIASMGTFDKSLILATKDKLNKLRGHVGIQQQIRVALEFSKNAIERTVSLQSNPEFHELNSEEKMEYLKYLKEDLMLEQERLDRDIKLTVAEIEQLRKYDRIQLLPQQKIPYLPMPEFAQNSLSLLNTVPYLVNENEMATQHPYLFDSKNIFNECIPTAQAYMQCMRKHMWAARLEDVPECVRLSSKLFTCQQNRTAEVQTNSTESWGQMITKWLWGDDDKARDGKSKTSQFGGNLSANTGVDVSSLALLADIKPTKSQQYAFDQRQGHAQSIRLQNELDQQRGQFDRQLQAEGLYYTPEQLTQRGDERLYYQGQQQQQSPFSSPHSPHPHISALSGRPIDPTVIVRNNPAAFRERDQQADMFHRFGPVDDDQVAAHHAGTYHDDYENLNPTHRHNHPYDHDSKKYSSNSYLFNTDHQYKFFVNPDDVDDQVEADWEYLEKYGTSDGQPFQLLRFDPPPQRDWELDGRELLWSGRFPDEERDYFVNTYEESPQDYERHIKQQSQTAQPKWF